MNDAVTMVRDAIHNPADARHFMRLNQPGHRVTATRNGQLIASSHLTTRVSEVGYDIYSPVQYFPRDDVRMQWLAPNGHTTHCPLKGDTEYFDVTLEDGQRLVNAAWSYCLTIDIAAALKGLIAFDVTQIQITEDTITTAS